MPVNIAALGTSVKGFQDSGYTTPTSGFFALSLVLPTVADTANSQYRGGVSIVIPNYPFSPNNAQFKFVPLWTRATYIDEENVARSQGQRVRFYWRQANLSWVLYVIT
jgi:hypothetical protein